MPARRNQPVWQASRVDDSHHSRRLFAEAATKSGLCWIRPDGTDRWWPVWHVWDDDAVLVVSGNGEQELPPLTGTVWILLRSKSNGARLVTAPAQVEPVDASTAEGQQIARTLAAGRLNADGLPAAVAQRWADDTNVRLTRLHPLSTVHDQVDHAAGSGAAPPAPTPAAPVVRRPWHLRGRRPRRT
ncbi:MAG: hypothetical protein ACRC35_01780 [Angustibacter sp.]